MTVRAFLLGASAHYCPVSFSLEVAFLCRDSVLLLWAERFENLCRLAYRGVAHQAALNGWLRVPRLLFLYVYSPEFFVRSLLLLPAPSAQYCLMGMVGRGADWGMQSAEHRE